MRESLKGLADVGETCLVQQDLLQDERGHCFGELAARLHYPQTERNNLSRQEEIDHVLLISLKEQGVRVQLSSQYLS